MTQVSCVGVKLPPQSVKNAVPATPPVLDVLQEMVEKENSITSQGQKDQFVAAWMKDPQGSMGTLTKLVNAASEEVEKTQPSAAKLIAAKMKTFTNFFARQSLWDNTIPNLKDRVRQELKSVFQEARKPGVSVDEYQEELDTRAKNAEHLFLPPKEGALRGFITYLQQNAKTEFLNAIQKLKA